MRQIRILLLLTALCACWSCGKIRQQDLLCNLAMELVLPDGANAITLEIDPALEGNYIRNLNTMDTCPFPVFVNNRGSVQLLKGAYLISFDGVATFADGTVRKVRCSEHAAPAQCVELLEGSATLTLNLLYLK